MENLNGEDWHIATGTSVLLATPDDSATEIRLEFHSSVAVGQPTTRADLLLDAISLRAHLEPQWVSEMIAWRIEHP
jgi:hypothetical protein